MKLFFVLLGCIIVVSVLTWMTLSLDKIEQARAEQKRMREAAAATHTQ